jgi:hypothetical protein
MADFLRPFSSRRLCIGKAAGGGMHRSFASLRMTIHY